MWVMVSNKLTACSSYSYSQCHCHREPTCMSYNWQLATHQKLMLTQLYSHIQFSWWSPQCKHTQQPICHGKFWGKLPNLNARKCVYLNVHAYISATCCSYCPFHCITLLIHRLVLVLTIINYQLCDIISYLSTETRVHNKYYELLTELIGVYSLCVMDQSLVS